MKLLITVLFTLYCFYQSTSAAKSSASNKAVSTILNAVSELGESECNQEADLFFAVDSSHSVGKTNFKQVKAFLKTITKTLMRKSDKFRFGFLVFSDDAKILVKLKDFDVKVKKQAKALLTFIDTDINYVSGKTVTGEAFQLLRLDGFKKSNGHRKGVKKMIVLLTDGNANGLVDTVKEAKKLHSDGVTIVPLGIGSDIKKSFLVSLSSRKKYVTMVKSFKDLGAVSTVITKIVCGGPIPKSSGKKPAVPKGHSKVCPKSYERKGSECVEIKPVCRKGCPEGFKLIFPCKCHPKKVTSLNCKIRCKKNEYKVTPCKCVKKIPEPRICKKCLTGFVHPKNSCKCVCKKKCSGKNFIQHPVTCKCKCSLRCVDHLRFNKKKCLCEQVSCPDGYDFYKKKCERIVKKYCKPGHVLYKDVCRLAKKCPKGYRKKLNRRCVRVGCKRGYKRVGKKCKKMCTGDKYYWDGKCNSPEKCTPKQYFSIRGSACQKTCNEPVLITECKKKRQPRCICQPYYLLHKGKCIHPSECPNIPICIQMADVIFMLDSSLTVTERNFYLMKNFIRDVVQQFYLKTGKRQRIGVIKFNQESKIILDLDSWKHYSHEKILKIIENIEYDPGLTFTGEALHQVREKMWNVNAGMRTDVPHVTILLTDGTKTNGEIDPFYEAKKLRADGSFFVTIAIGEDAKRTRKQMLKLAGPEGRVFLFGLQEFQDLHSLVARVVAFHCERPLCPRPISREGVCKDNYKSITRIEYIRDGYRCKKVVHNDWKKVRCSCPHAKQESDKCVKMYKNVVTTSFKLDEKKHVCNSKDTKSKVRCGCKPSTKISGKCINEYRTLTYTKQKLVPGGPDGFTCKPVTETKKLRCACPKSKKNYTKCKSNFKIMHEDFFEFNSETRTCVKRKRTKEIRCNCPKPSLVTGHCNGKFVPVKFYEQVVNNRNQCDQRVWTSQKKCKKSCSKILDLAFVVDSSDSVRGSNFEYIRRFIIALTNKLKIGADEAHVALLKYSSKENLKVIFNYISHYSAKSMKERIEQMRYSPGTTYTGDALKNYRHFLMSPVNGWRGAKNRDIDSILLLVTDGASNSKISSINEAKKIKAMNTRIITVGVGDDIQDSELNSISTSPSDIYAFKAAAFRDLVHPSFVHDIFMATCKVGKVNKVSVFKKYQNKMNDVLSKGENLNFKEMGFLRIKKRDLSHFEFKISGKYITVVGDSQAARDKFLSDVRNSIAKAVRLHPYSIERVHISRKMLLSGLVLTAYVDTLFELVTKKRLNIVVRGHKVIYDEKTFVKKSYEALEVVRQATEAADVALNVMRPLRRLVKMAADAAPKIRKEKPKKAAMDEVKKMNGLRVQADAAADALIIASNNARKSRKEKDATEAIKQFRSIMTVAAKVARRISYVAYFCRAGQKQILKRDLRTVTDRLTNAYSELGIAETKIAASKEKKKEASKKPVAVKEKEKKTPVPVKEKEKKTPVPVKEKEKKTPVPVKEKEKKTPVPVKEKEKKKPVPVKA